MSALLFEQHRTGGQSAHNATAKSRARVSVWKGTFKYMLISVVDDDALLCLSPF